MEQLYNAMVTYMQTPQERPAAKGGTADKDGFQKLLEQKQNTDAASGPKQERPEAAEAPQERPAVRENPQETQEAPQEGQELEERMVLAAMAMMQAPVVPVEQVMTPEVQAEAVVDEAVVDEVAPLAAEGLLTQEDQALVPETETGAELSVEGELLPAEDQTLAEEIPQPIEAPQAAHETEGRTVEVKVETVEDRPQEVQEEGDSEEMPELRDAGAEAPVFEEVKAVPVKVGEAPVAEKAEKPVETQIGDRLAEALKAGETHVELQLTPENLGKVTVEMTLSKEGGLVVQLHAENRDTQSLLSKNLSGLENLLSRESQQEVRVEVPRQEESQRQDLYEQQQNHHRQQQQERRRSRESDGEAFMQQLRLGLIPMDGE